MATCKPSAPYLNQLRERYRKATKTQRTKMLDEFVATTGYHRKYAIPLLRGTRELRDRTQPIHRRRPRLYLAEDKRAVLWLAELFDQISSKRLRAAMDVELDALRAHLQVSRTCFQRLHHISPSTMDRMRHSVPRSTPRHRGGTKPGALLKTQIKIRTFADWEDKRPGFAEIDLVQHEGGNPNGFFACTLNLTDVSTGWTECRAVPTKAQKHVFAALKQLRTQLPFPLRGIDSDNGAEFINDELVRYCVQERLTFTRGRVGRKNDNPFVEQKNWSVVRRLVGYGRYETPTHVQQLNRLYACYRLYVNHFLPVQKLIAKERTGSKVKKIYDAPKTPYQRVLDSLQVSSEAKQNLRTIHAQLDLITLKQQLDALLEPLVPSKQW
jgi:hypothetical protein